MPQNCITRKQPMPDFVEVLSGYLQQSPWHLRCLTTLASAQAWFHQTHTKNPGTSEDQLELWIAAGFVRNLVWDHLHGYPAGKTEDVDVIYHSLYQLPYDSPYQSTYDSQTMIEREIPKFELLKLETEMQKRENELQKREESLLKHLLRLAPDIPWQVRDQARMHLRNDDSPYGDIADAMKHWPEKETAVAVRLMSELKRPRKSASLNDVKRPSESTTPDREKSSGTTTPNLLNKEDLQICAPFGLELLWKGKISWNPRRQREIFTQRLEQKKWLERWPTLRPE